jgi:hypothetical protein
MPIPAELVLTPEQLDEIMLTSWNMRIATVGPGSRINLTPLWFGWAGGNIYTYCRGQKVVNLRRNPIATILVDRMDASPSSRLPCSRAGLPSSKTPKPNPPTPTWHRNTRADGPQIRRWAWRTS